jgi:hypothetical protein
MAYSKRDLAARGPTPAPIEGCILGLLDNPHRVHCYVANIGKYAVILGTNWMDDNWPTLTSGMTNQRSMRFATRPGRCLNTCCAQGMSETVYDDHSPALDSERC